MAGKGLGYITPALYQIAASPAGATDFRDITSGNNSFSGQAESSATCSFAGSTVNVSGYDAVQGWDPVTGLGSPIANKLLPDLVAVLAK